MLKIVAAWKEYLQLFQASVTKLKGVEGTIYGFMNPVDDRFISYDFLLNSSLS